jgi:photosystem II stability/assembly factor-like uncharacterized protein
MKLKAGILIGIVALTTFCIYWFYYSSSSPASNPFFDGPDRALVHNHFMIEDRQLGRVPYERLQDAKRVELFARVKEDRDFKWKNWNTKIPGRARMVYFNPTTNVLFSGSVTGGLWKNSDYKNNAAWEKVNGFDGVSVNCIATDPNNSNVLYIGTGESFTAIINYRESTGVGNGIYKSDDGGLTWAQIPSTANFFFVNDLIVRDEDGISVLYVAVGSGTYQGSQFIQEGLYRSSNGGSTWQQVLPNIPGTGLGYCVSDLELSPDNKIYAGTMRNINTLGGGDVLSSSDGISWNRFSEFSDFTKGIGWSAGRTVIKAAPSNANHMYALFTMGITNSLSQLRDYEVFMKHSMDGGNTWQDITLPTGWANIPWHALSLAVDPINENKVLIGALDTYVLNDASQTSITTLDWIKVSDWAAMYDIYDPNLSQEEKDAAFKRYVHGDIHDLQFIDGSSDEMLITTDGGVFYSENMSITINIDPENPVQEFPVFKQVNNAINTTQYYYGRIHPLKGIQEALGGAQDNGSVYVNNTIPDSQVESMISGGDGGYCFWDINNPTVKITTVYGNRYYIHVGSNIHWIGNPQFPINGLFVNPMDYDEASNLIYSNAMTSTYGGLYKTAKHPYYDTLEIVNINSFLGTPTLGLPVVSFVKLNAGIQDAITAIKLSRHSVSSNKTAFIGTEKGKVYKVNGLPGPVTTTRIDNNQLPTGYISSIDIGRNEDRIVVTFSNFGLSSVWLTLNAGLTWTNIERNLPDMPVRWGAFNPYDDYKILLATEMGIWGLENTGDENEQWKSYNNGFPEIRVDMIDIRKEDSTVLAVTHGGGFWVGKFNQGEAIITAVNDEEINDKRSTWLYPNPASNFITASPEAQVKMIIVYDALGRAVQTFLNNDLRIDIRELETGTYFFEGVDWLGKRIPKQRIVVNK